MALHKMLESLSACIATLFSDAGLTMHEPVVDAPTIRPKIFEISKF